MSQEGYPEDLSGYSMLDLFRLEVREQVRELTDGLLVLERGGADAATLERLMRAAHSIKGAATIVGLDAVVQLAHAMEDAFVAAQQDRLRLDGGDVDTLLTAVDLMLALGALPDGGLADATDSHGDALAEAMQGLAALHARARPDPVAAPPKATAPPPRPAPEPQPVPEPATVPEPPPVPAPAPPLPPPPAAAPPVPVATPVETPAGAGEDLLALAGQARLYANQMQPWITGLQFQRRQQHGLLAALDQLREAIAAAGQPDLLDQVALVQARAAPLSEALHRTIQDAEQYERRTTAVAARLVDGVLALRMCPFGDGVHGLARMVRDLARGLGKDARLDVRGAATPVDRAVLARIEGPLNQLLRNAVDHGVETPAERAAAGKPPGATIRLEARHRGGMFVLDIEDDGRGVDPERIRRTAVARGLAQPALAASLTQAELMEFLFLPGFSLKEEASTLSGRGVGLDVVREAAQTLNGSLRAESRPGAGFRTTITLPLTQSIVRALVVDVAGEAYALPVARIERVLRLPLPAVRTLSGRQYCVLAGEDDAHVSLVPASQVLALGEVAAGDQLSVIVIGTGRERYGLVVEAIRGEQGLIVQPLEPVFGKLRDVAAGALLDDGTPVLVLDVPDLLQSIGRLLDAGAPLRVLAGASGAANADARPRRVLVVDDSLTVREMQRQILAKHGYHVDVALDGIDGWNMLRTHDYDLVITDIDMPRLDGIGLLERIRQDPRLGRLPAMIVSYKDRPEDRTRGLGAGADHYMAKGAFHDATLLEAVRDLVGGPEGAA